MPNHPGQAIIGCAFQVYNYKAATEFRQPVDWAYFQAGAYNQHHVTLYCFLFRFLKIRAQWIPEQDYAGTNNAAAGAV